MAQPTIQASFNSGEWAPQLYARVDQEKYHSGAALLRNFFVDYRGGASTRTGSKYLLQAYKSATAVRIIPFQASFTVGYILEFGDQYIRFYNNGAPVLETGLNITGATKANPCVVSVTNSYSVGDWVYISGVSGMSQLNGHYYIVHAHTAGTITLYDLFGNPVDSSAFGAWTAGGTTQRVYTIASPYAAADLALIKFAQNVTTLVLCHPNYTPYTLTITSATNWALTPITFGTTVGTPTGVAVTTGLSAGAVNYSYIVTAVDNNGQESAASSPAALLSKLDLRTVAGTNTITWNSVSSASSYNVYKSEVNVGAAVPVGVPYGFIGNCTATTFVDSNIAPDFSQTPPIVRNPFVPGSGVLSATITAAGSYTTAPTVSFSSPPTGGVTATGIPVLAVINVTVATAGTSYAVGDTLTFTGGIILRVTIIGLSGDIQGATVVNPGAFSGPLSSNPLAPITTSGSGINATFNFTYGVVSIYITAQGAGYSVAPSITFSAGAASATANLGPATAGYPAVPAFFQQRLVLAGPTASPQAFYMSQPGSYYNFNVSNPVQADDAISGTIISGQLNNIKSMVPQPAGLLVLTDGASYLINGGSAGSAVTPSSIVANAQSFNGASDVPPIVSNYDVLYVQSKGSSVRDSTYNFYANVFTGTDITIVSSQLFYGFHIHEWCWAEEPYKVAWAVRSDGDLLSCTFMKEQEFVGWSHHDTNGLYKSVATIIETTTQGDANAVYVVVQRTVQGQSLQYIERFADRYFPNGIVDAWCVDAGLQYNGAPATSFTGGEHLAGLSCTGLADGVIIPAFVMPTNGAFTLATPASKVTVGLAFTPQLQTLPIDLGQPTVQSKVKKITGVTVRVAQTLGLRIGSDSTHLVPMKDLVRGNVSGMLTGQSSQIITDLTNGDAFTQIDPTYTVPGQYFIEQSYPYPASILGVIPQVMVGDSK